MVTIDYLYVTIVLPFLDFYINGIKKYVISALAGMAQG